MPRWSSVQRGRCLRVHPDILSDGLLRRKEMRPAGRSNDDGLRLGRQRLRHVRDRTKLRERRLQLRGRGLRGMLRRRYLQHHTDRSELRSRRRHVRQVRAKTGVQRSGQVRVHAQLLSQRVL